jgi:hypothetical protein
VGLKAPHAQDDRSNLDDMHQAELAVIAAQDALRAAMVGQGPRQRERFVFYIGIARSRLLRVSSRIIGEVAPPLLEEDELLKGGEDAP